MAIESLRFMQFSSKSDIWSYGVLLWEIFTMGGTPWPGMAWSLEFVDQVEHGLRMKRPEFCPHDV